jgi:hypothetical protein
MSGYASDLRVKDRTQQFPSKEAFMRSPYIALGLAFFLFACESPTGPGISPSVDAGHESPVTPDTSPEDCLKRLGPAALATGQNGLDDSGVSPCTTEEPGGKPKPIL